MTGSGAAVFGLFAGEEAAGAARAKLAPARAWCSTSDPHGSMEFEGLAQAGPALLSLLPHTGMSQSMWIVTARSPFATVLPNIVLLLVGLAVFVGILEIGLGLGKLGFVADLLSNPVRTGYLAGLAVVIFIGQLPKLFGFSTDASGLVAAIAVVLLATACDKSFLHKVKPREPATDTTCAPDGPVENLFAIRKGPEGSRHFGFAGRHHGRGERKDGRGRECKGDG